MSFDPMDDSDSDTNSHSNSINNYIKDIGPDLSTSPELKNKRTKMPALSDEDSSDSYVSFSRKKGKKDIKSSQRQKSETDDNIFTTSQNPVDYTKLDGKLTDLQSDDEDSEKIIRRPPPSSVAFHLRSSSDDEDGTTKPKSKPKMPLRRKPAGSTAPKKIRFEQIDDSASQFNERPKARSTAPSVSSTRSSKSSKSRKWTPEVIEENPLDRELKQLVETESRIDAAEREKLLQDDFYISDKMSKSGDNRSQKSRKQVQQQEQESDDESLSKPLQTVAEEQYAKMLKKKFPQLVKKKVYQQNMQNNKYKLNFNNDIINWSREMIANANESIQKEIDQIKKELKRLRRENRELKEDINGGRTKNRKFNI